MAKREDIKAYIDGNVADTVALIKGDVEAGELSKDDLLMLQDAEAEGGKRQGVLGELAKLIDAAPESGVADLDDLDDAEVDTDKPDELDGTDDAADDTDNGVTDEEADIDDEVDIDNDDGGKEARGEKIDESHFKHPDYNGSLTSEQAMWRNENITIK